MAAQSRDEPEPYSLPARMISGTCSGVVALGRLEDRRHLAVGEEAGEAPLGPGRQLVAEADVGEGPADHHLVVAAARAVGVEVEDVDAVLDQVASRRALHLDRARRRDVVGGDAVAQDRQGAGPADLRDRLGLGRHPDEVRGVLDVGRGVVPLVEVALRHRQRVPVLVALEDLAVLLVEHLGADRLQDRVLDLALGRPDVLEVDRLAARVVAQRLVRGGRCPSCRPGRRRRPAGARRGSWRGPRS